MIDAGIRPGLEIHIKGDGIGHDPAALSLQHQFKVFLCYQSLLQNSEMAIK